MLTLIPKMFLTIAKIFPSAYPKIEMNANKSGEFGSPFKKKKKINNNKNKILSKSYFTTNQLTGFGKHGEIEISFETTFVETK